MRRTSAMITLAAAVVALAAAPAAARAQESRTVLVEDLPPQEQMRVRAEAEARASEADDLLRQAEIAESEGEARKAARLYQRSGDLRDDGDPLASEAYGLAARAYYRVGDTKTASRMAEVAAVRALTHGDVFAAAEGFIKASVAAREGGDRERASDLGWKAYRLLQSDALDPEERRSLRSRLVLPPS